MPDSFNHVTIASKAFFMSYISSIIEKVDLVMNESSANNSSAAILKIGDKKMAYSTGASNEPWTVPSRRSKED
jgi:hypothetical protein